MPKQTPSTDQERHRDWVRRWEREWKQAMDRIEKNRDKIRLLERKNDQIRERAVNVLLGK